MYTNLNEIGMAIQARIRQAGTDPSRWIPAAAIRLGEEDNLVVV
jgi:hypothetical protein